MRHSSACSASAFRTASWILFLVLAALLPASAQEEGKRIALIVGNNNYSISPLRNAVNDARLMDKALRSAGFKTILREDATYTAMEEAAAELAQQVGPDDTALFFYAGHGIQIDSENFLVPVDFEAANTIIQAKFKCFRLGQLFEELKKRSKRTIFILDACRSNPVAESHSLQSGLAQPQVAGSETFIAFSTSPGQVAADNPSGRDSWFTEALADLIDQPALTLDDVFTRVKSRVSSETESRQSPWTISSLTTTFYFHAPSTLQVANDPSVAEKWMLQAQKREQREDWAQAIGLLHQVIERKPGGSLEASAIDRLPYLTLRKDAQEKFDAAEYKESAGLYEKSLDADPFSIDSAFRAVDSYLMSDQLPDAVRLLRVVRLRGTSESVAKANAMLKELGSAFPEAAEVINTGIPAPPPVQELFKNVQFGVPDWNAGMRSVQASPVPLSRWEKALETAYPPPAEPTTAAADSAKLVSQIFHIEVNPTSEARDISIRPNDPQGKNGPTGSLMLIGALGSAHVLAAGAPVADQLPATITLPPGKYEIRTVEKGQVITKQEVEVVAYQTKTVTVQGKQ